MIGLVSGNKILFVHTYVGVYTILCMSVCVYVCIHVCMYEYKYVCMYVCMPLPIYYMYVRAYMYEGIMYVNIFSM